MRYEVGISDENRVLITVIALTSDEEHEVTISKTRIRMTRKGNAIGLINIPMENVEFIYDNDSNQKIVFKSVTEQGHYTLSDEDVWEKLI